MCEFHVVSNYANFSLNLKHVEATLGSTVHSMDNGVHCGFIIR